MVVQKSIEKIWKFLPDNFMVNEFLYKYLDKNNFILIRYTFPYYIGEIMCTPTHNLSYVYRNLCIYTVNGERFTRLNFRSFRDFEEDRESFSVNILHEL